MSDLVWRAGRAGKVWHWRQDQRHGPTSWCSGWPLAGISAPPVSVRIEDRCTAKGCAVRWDAWLRATVKAALGSATELDAAESERLWGAA